MFFDDQTLAAKAAIDLLQSDANNLVNTLDQDIALANTQIATDQATIADLKAQLAALPSAKFPDLTILSALERDLWTVHVGPNIGGSVPAANSYTITNGQLVMSVTGTKGQWCDWLLANKKPLPNKTFTKLLLNMNITPDANPQYVQCLEFDTLIVESGFKYNLSSQIVYGSGKLQIANGATRGGWLDSGIVVGKLVPSVKHAVRWLYAIDRTAKTGQYIAFILDGKRYDIDPKVGTQPAYAETWSDQLTLQLQQDTNSQGGTFTTAFDSITYVAIA